jgi:hypothetical protein
MCNVTSSSNLSALLLARKNGTTLFQLVENHMFSVFFNFARTIPERKLRSRFEHYLVIAVIVVNVLNYWFVVAFPRKDSRIEKSEEIIGNLHAATRPCISLQSSSLKHV